jgi:hypothetical protein
VEGLGPVDDPVDLVYKDWVVHVVLMDNLNK